jgi:glucoamylase
VIAQETRRPVEMLQSVEQHFGPQGARGGSIWHWRDEVPVWHLQTGKSLSIEDRQPFTLHFGYDGWQQLQDREAQVQPFGMWSVRLSSDELALHRELNFTRRYPAGWEGLDHQVSLGHPFVAQALSQTGAG